MSAYMGGHLVMLLDKIQSWLEGSQNFIIGRALYNQLGNNERIKELLQKGENTASKNILVAAMRELVQKPLIISTKKFDSTVDEIPESTDAILKALRNEWLPLYSEMNYKRARLDEFGNSNSAEAIAARKELAFDILTLEKKCMVIWKKRDEYLKIGSITITESDEDTIPTEAFELGKFIETCKKNIRRNRKKMQEPGADSKYAELYKHYLTLYKKATGKDYNEKNKL